MIPFFPFLLPPGQESVPSIAVGTSFMEIIEKSYETEKRFYIKKRLLIETASSVCHTDQIYSTCLPLKDKMIGTSAIFPVHSTDRSLFFLFQHTSELKPLFIHIDIMVHALNIL